MRRDWDGGQSAGLRVEAGPGVGVTRYEKLLKCEMDLLPGQASLRAFGEHYFYARHKKWLEAVAPAMVKACSSSSSRYMARKERP
jgi:hypothetical protein